MKKKQTELKDTIMDIKNVLEDINNRLKEEISKLENRVVEISQAEQTKIGRASCRERV